MTVSLLAAVAVGIAYSVLSGAGVGAWNPICLVFAAIGTCIGATVWRIVHGTPYASHDQQSVRRSY